MRRGTARTSIRRKLWLLRGLGAVLLAVTFGYLPYHLYARSGFADYLRLREDLRVLRVNNGRLRIDNERLAREADALRSDLRAVERVARAELGWVKPGEVIFEVGEEEAAPARPPLPGPRSPPPAPEPRQ